MPPVNKMSIYYEGETIAGNNILDVFWLIIVYLYIGV